MNHYTSFLRVTGPSPVQLSRVGLTMPPRRPAFAASLTVSSLGLLK